MKKENLPNEIPVFPLPNAIFFPTLTPKIVVDLIFIYNVFLNLETGNFNCSRYFVTVLRAIS